MDYSILRKILIDCFKLDTIDYERAKVLTIAHDTDRSFLHNGKYYCPLVDTVEDDLARKDTECVSVARIASRIKGELSYGNARSPEGHFARALLVKRVAALFARGTYPYSRLEEQTWGEILDVTQARKVIGIQPSRELCTASHKRGVWVADVQHGVIADQHPWYGEAFRAQDLREYLPDAFLCWDHGSAQCIEPWARGKGIATTIIGNRWLARFLRPAADDALVQGLLQQYARQSAAEADRKAILVSLSWGEYTIPNGFIIEGLERVIRRTSDQFRWLIRLHPNQITGFASHELAKFIRYFGANLQGHAQWQVATAYPLPVVLRHVDMHISWSSSVCIEAAQAGVKSALLDPRLRATQAYDRYFEYFRGLGMVELIEESEAAVTAWIEANAGQRIPPEDYSAFDREYRGLVDFLAQ